MKNTYLGRILRVLFSPSRLKASIVFRITAQLKRLVLFLLPADIYLRLDYLEAELGQTRRSIHELQLRLEHEFQLRLEEESNKTRRSLHELQLKFEEDLNQARYRLLKLEARQHLLRVGKMDASPRQLEPGQ